jgi:sugar/nucleoside kinase (ribokinase family)
MRTVALGVHVVDVLVRPVEVIPEGQGGQLVQDIRITPAGPAGGTAITLAKLGS